MYFIVFYMIKNFIRLSPKS